MTLDVLNRVMFLVPDASCCVRSIMSESDSKAAEYANETVMPYDNVWILWSSKNSVSCPSVEALKAVTADQLNNHLEKVRKNNRDKEKMDDLTLVALFDAESKQNPKLTFSEYLDNLEIKRDNLKRK